MYIEEPPRPLNLPPELRARRRVKEETGSVPVAVHRATIDGRVFRGIRRKRGAGSVLIDQSGSMCFTEEDIQHLIRLLPGSIIATYSGSEYMGTLRILAKNGKSVERDDLYIGMGGNVIDGPAVEWLSKQPKPRIWVCDGHITGIGDCHASQDLINQVRSTMRRSQIFRVPNMTSLKEKLAKLT